MNRPKIAFETERLNLSLDAILPVRQLNDPQKQFIRYKTILASIKEVGVIEPLMVYPQKGRRDQFLLMDGHLRYYALKELGIKDAECLITTEDESYTFNARINRLSPIQEHTMIMKAVKNGVTPKRIASALNLKLRDIGGEPGLLFKADSHC